MSEERRTTEAAAHAGGKPAPRALAASASVATAFGSLVQGRIICRCGLRVEGGVEGASRMIKFG